jgi:hypothetical protein
MVETNGTLSTTSLASCCRQRRSPLAPLALCRQRRSPLTTLALRASLLVVCFLESAKYLLRGLGAYDFFLARARS